jgi:opacity protein-like surface antigen
MIRIRSFTSLCLICLFSAAARAQTTAPYIIFKVTNAFAANPGKLNEATANVGNRTFTKGIYGSYGRGLALQLGIGKMINSTFGFEVSGEYLFGRNIKSSTDYSEDSIFLDVSERIRGWIIKPMIVVRNSGDLLSIYSKVGLAVSIATHRFQEENMRFVSAQQGDQTITESKENSKAKVGFAASFGLAFRIAESASIFLETNGQMLSLPINRGHYTKYQNNGVDQLRGMSVREKSWIYERKGYFDDPSDPGKPERRLYSPANFSYIGIGAGIIYHF